MPVSYLNTTTPARVAQNQRQMVQWQGDILNQQELDRAEFERQQRLAHQGQLGEIYQPWMAGEGGYSPEERAAIEASGGLEGLALTPEQGEANYLTDDERRAMMGDTSGYYGYFNPSTMLDAQAGSAGRQRGAVSGLKVGLRTAIDPARLRQSQEYLDQADQDVGAARNDTMATLYGEAENVRGAIRPEDLKTSASFLNDYKMTPEEEQDIVTGAGITAGMRGKGAVTELERSSRAAGMSPAGVAAYKEHAGRESAAASADAMTQARIQASNTAAQREQIAEQMRQQGEQYLTNVEAGTELSMGQQALGLQERLAAQQLGQTNLKEQGRLGAERYLTGAEMAAATTGGEAELSSEQAMNAQERNTQQYLTNTGTGITMAGDKANADRAAAIAANRQATGRTNQTTRFGQGYTINQTASERAKAIADQRKKEQTAGLGYYGGLVGMENRNQQGAYGRQQQTYGTQVGGTGRAAETAVKAAGVPTWYDKLTGTLVNAANAASKFMPKGKQSGPGSGSGGGFGSGEGFGPEGGGWGFGEEEEWGTGEGQAEGKVITEPGVYNIGESGPEAVMSGDYLSDDNKSDYLGGGKIVTRPTRAVLGERGPEVVVPLNRRPGNRVWPGILYGT